MREIEPNRTDHYLMQIAMEVRRVLSKHPGRIKLSHFKLKFDNEDGNKKVDYKKLAPYSIASWKGVVMGVWDRMTKARNKTNPAPTTPAVPPTPASLPIPQKKRRGAR